MTNILVHLLQILLVFLVLSMPTLAAVFLSIDCGSSGSFIDANNVTWVGDDPYTKSGEKETVPNVDDSVDRPFKTRRVFRSRKKNCYSIDVGKGEHVLLRAHFYYGTYTDETFDLQFDGNYWATVRNSSTNPSYYEVIYLTKFDAISVCVARNQRYPNDVPFISAIEVRSLDVGMYGGVDSTYPSFSIKRTNYGENRTVRFPDDKYDRIWGAFPGGNGLIGIRNEKEIVAAGLSNQPPKSVLQTAVHSDRSGSFIYIRPPQLLYDRVYSIFYFSELERLSSSDKRSFSIYLNGKNISRPVVPPNGTALEMSFTTTLFDGTKNIEYRLNSSADSTLPPMINAVEMFQVGSALTNGTNNKHVKALSMLQQAFVQLQDWSGDPCLPNGFPWDWVQCTFSSSETAPQITALNLSNYGLQGSLPNFSALDTLQIIDLQNNSLSGEIPSFLGNFPSLNMLNLANNSFSGLIPSLLTNNSNLTLVYSGNADLCAPNQSSCANSVNRTSNLPPFTSSPSNISKNLPITLAIVTTVGSCFLLKYL